MLHKAHLSRVGTRLQCLNSLPLSTQSVVRGCRRSARVGTAIARAAASEETQAPASACPFAEVVRTKHYDATTGALPADVKDLQGSGWKVLPDGNVEDLPEPEGYFCWNPLLGDFQEFEREGAGAFLLKRWKDFGPVFTWQLGQQKLVAVVNHETIKTLLQQGDSKIMTGWNPESLYAMLGESTRQNLENPASRMMSRKLMAPGFSREAMRQYLTKLEKIISTQLEDWSTSGRMIDMSTEGKALSFEFSTELLVDFAIPADQKDDLKRKFNLLFQGMFAAPINLPGTTFNKALKAKAELLQDIINVIKQGQDSSNTELDRTSSVFRYNLEARRQTQTSDGVLTEQQMAEAGIGLIIAGNDTSGLGVSALMSILPLFPEVMEKLRQEQQELIAKYGPELSSAVIDNMAYGEAVVKEVLRVAPPSDGVQRRTLVDMEIGGKFIPKGSVLFLSFFMGQLLSDPKLHKHITPEALRNVSPEQLLLNATTIKREFHPERWLADPNSSSGDLPKPAGLLTFNTGPHICLGMGLFYTEAKVLLALLARGYNMEIQNPEEVGFHASFVTQLNSQPLVRFSKVPAGAGAVMAKSKLAAR